MEIEFNPSRIPKTGYSEPVARWEPVKAGQQTAPSPSASDLEAKLKEIPLLRSEKVDQIKPLTSDLKYPPNGLLYSISALLAANIDQ